MINEFKMKFYKNLGILVLVMSLVSNCSSAQKMQTNVPVTLGNVYCQKWVSGVKGGGSGLDLFIPISKVMPMNIQLDSVYYRGKGVKLEKIESESNIYVGRFLTSFNSKKDIVMSDDMMDEYGNEKPSLEKKPPFELNDSECVVSYKEGKEIKYFKIEAITEKSANTYPNAPSNKY